MLPRKTVYRNAGLAKNREAIDKVILHYNHERLHSISDSQTPTT